MKVIMMIAYSFVCVDDDSQRVKTLAEKVKE